MFKLGGEEDRDGLGLVLQSVLEPRPMALTWGGIFEILDEGC